MFFLFVLFILFYRSASNGIVKYGSKLAYSVGLYCSLEYVASFCCLLVSVLCAPGWIRIQRRWFARHLVYKLSHWKCIQRCWGRCMSTVRGILCCNWRSVHATYFFWLASLLHSWFWNVSRDCILEECCEASFFFILIWFFKNKIKLKIRFLFDHEMYALGFIGFTCLEIKTKRDFFCMILLRYASVF